MQNSNPNPSPQSNPVQNSSPQNISNSRKKLNPADQLKNRLFEKGVGHSSMSYFKSPLSTDYANRVLLVNLNSSKYCFIFIILVLINIHLRLSGSKLPVCLIVVAIITVLKLVTKKMSATITLILLIRTITVKWRTGLRQQATINFGIAIINKVNFYNKSHMK